MLARQAATTDIISGGRFLLGIGTGVYETDHAMAGVEVWQPKERVERLDEFITVVDQLLRGEEVTTAGPYYPIRDGVVRPQPIQRPRPPLIVGALGPRTIRLAVRRADAWNTWAGFNSDETAAVDAVRRQSSLVDAACEQEGRDPATLSRSICLYPPFDPWASPRALERLVEILSPFGIREFIAYAPPSDKVDLLASAVAHCKGAAPRAT